MGVITQSGLCEYVSEEHYQEYEKLLGKLQVQDLKLPDEVITIDEKKTPLEAFRLMRDKKVSGLAIVDENGKLKDVISVRDLMVSANFFF